MQPVPAPDAQAIVGILLAAGAGSRFDPSGHRNKLLASPGRDDVVVAMAARAMLAALPNVLAVVRDGDAETAAVLAALGCRVSICPYAAQGLSASLLHGLAQTQNAQGWVIALGDMPYVQPSTIRALADALSGGADIVVPSYCGRRGNPVGFRRIHLTALMQLRGDQGARRLLNVHPVTEITVDDDGILRDIDTVNDLTGSANHIQD